jgi:hypothetical protein
MTPAKLALLLRRRPNLFRNSEGLAATGANVTNVTNAAASIAGFDNSIQFPAGATLAIFYRGFIQTLGVTYTLSAFVEMDDGAAPTVGVTNATGDFSMQVRNAVSAPSRVDQIGATLWRVSTPFVSDGTTPNIGVLRYATQSGKAFRVTGYQLNTGLTASAYQKTGA